MKSPSIIAAGFVAAIVGFAGPLAILLSAAQSVGATHLEISSWVSGLALAIAVSTFVLSFFYRIPIICSWSTPGLALLAATTGYSMKEAVGAFILVGLFIIATALIKPLLLVISRIPSSISSGMLAGVLLSFVLAAANTVETDPWFILPLLILFFVVRLFQPALAVIVVLIAGIIMAFLTSHVTTLPPLEISTLTFIKPEFSWSTMFGLALPLYLVTMASQNLPGFAVLKTFGYEAPIKSCLGVTGLTSIITAFFGASTTNISALSASICTGPDAHNDKSKRWLTTPYYCFCYIIFALFSSTIVAFFLALPPTLIILVAGVGLLGAFINALTLTCSIAREQLAAVVTFIVTASGLTFFGIGAPFWALITGIMVYNLDFLRQK